MNDVEPTEITPDKLYARVLLFEFRLRRLYIITVTAVIGVIVCASGWWLTANDHSAQQRNGRVGDCRASAQAQRLDDFTFVIVGSKIERDIAAERIHDGELLVKAYAKCIKKG